MDQHATSSIELYVPDFVASSEPFAHVAFPMILAPASADRVLTWLRTDAPWRLRVASFYEQYEFSLISEDNSTVARELRSARLIEGVRRLIQSHFAIRGQLALVDIAAHKLTVGQTIRIHNDSLCEQETHRVLIQVNEGWSLDCGGLLMLFRGKAPEDVHSVIQPTHGSGFAFAISDRSFHAVSTIRMNERFTLVYTFRDG